MRYLALATDYDGTLATHGTVPASTVQALESLQRTGRRLLMVTGRQVPDLKQVFGRLDLFDCIVAENGAVLFDPKKQKETVLAEPPSPEFVEALRARGVQFGVGRSVVATSEPFAETALEAIRDTGVEMQVIFNKGSVMLLPSRVNKATGVAAALERMRLSAHNVVGVGDAENDHALLASCEFGVAVSNAVAQLKERADWVTAGARSEGVEELIGRIIDDDLCSLEERVERHIRKRMH